MHTRSAAVIGRFSGFVLALVVALLLTTRFATAQVVPAAVISSNQTLASISGNSGHVAVNSFGAVFYVSTNDHTVYELLPGSTTPVALVTGVSSATNVYVDAANNLYVPGLYSSAPARLLVVPYLNGSYATTVDSGTALSNTICTSPLTVACNALNSGTSTTGYYVQIGDVGKDAAGDVYIVDPHDNNCNQGGASTNCNTILKFAAPADSNTVPTKIAGGVGGGLAQSNNAQIAVDAQGDVYYVDGVSNNVYFIAAGTSVPAGQTIPTIGSGFKTPGGVSVDKFGNVYVTDTGNNRIVEIPAVNGVAQSSKEFTLSWTYSANGVGVDPLGRLFYTGYSGGTNINIMTLWNTPLGSSAVGTANAAQTLNVVFSAAATPSNIAITGGNTGFSLTGGSCGAGTTCCAAGTAYSMNQSCTLTVAYTPTAVGLQTGSVSITGADGSNLATGYLSGIGLGAAQTVDPGTLTAVGSGWKSPQGVALDGAGNLYVADATANTVSLFAPGATTATTVGTGLSQPSAVAVDGAGNVYIGDSGNGRIVEVPMQAGVLNNSAQSVVMAGLNGTTTGLATDYTGSLYVADSGNKRVLRITNTSGTLNPSYTATIGTGFKAPVAVATDSKGDVFIADQDANDVVEITPLSSAQVQVGSSLSGPSGLAVDPAGSVYIADSGNYRIIKIPNENGSLNENDKYQIGQTIAKPNGLALDPKGNLYVTDSKDASVSQIVRTQGTLDLGRANINVATSTLSSQIANSGNQNLIFGTPLYTTTGTDSVFTVASPSSGGCVAGQTLNPGFNCVLNATFITAAKGSFSDVLSFSSTPVNTSTPQLTLLGVGTSLATSQVSLAVTAPTTAPAYGQPVTITASITSTNGGGGTPSGTVSFLLDGNLTGSLIQVVNGQASIPLNNLSGGSHSVGATYSGDDNFAASAGTPIQFAVSKAASATSLVISGGAVNPQSATPGSSVSLVATVVQQGAATPTQTVTFLNGSTVLGTASVNGKTATLVTTTLPTGTLNIVASYGGDVNYAGSSSAAVSFIVSPATFVLSSSSMSLTVPSGGSGNINFTVTPISGYSGTIGIACSGLPANSSCSFNPNAFQIQPYSPATSTTPASGGSQTVTVTILTGQVPVVPPQAVGRLNPHGPFDRLPVAFAFLLLGPIGLTGRQLLKRHGKSGTSLIRLLTLLVFLAAGVGASMVSGCSSGLLGVTPAGSSTVKITVSGAPVAATAQTAQLTLQVQ
jgi:trimeric autotransporter adhesin